MPISLPPSPTADTSAPHRPPVRVRAAHADERDAVRALTGSAYAEYAAVMTPAAWAALEGAVGAALAVGFEVATCLVAVRDDVSGDAAPGETALLGSVFLFPPASDAYAGLTAPPRWPELRLLAVDPTARGLGVGEALVAACAREARAAGATALTLHTSASMRAARRLYARLGFVRDPSLDFRPGGAELVEGYRLPLELLPAASSDASAAR